MELETLTVGGKTKSRTRLKGIIFQRVSFVKHDLWASGIVELLDVNGPRASVGENVKLVER